MKILIDVQTKKDKRNKQTNKETNTIFRSDNHDTHKNFALILALYF